MKSISVIGLERTGLLTTTLSTTKGLKAVDVTVDASKVKAIYSGKCYDSWARLSREIAIPHRKPSGIKEATSLEGKSLVEEKHYAEKRWTG